MRSVHGAIPAGRVAVTGKSTHVRAVANRNREDADVCSCGLAPKRLVDIKQTPREMGVPSTRDADLLGLCGPDFAKMTRGLFDR